VHRRALLSLCGTGLVGLAGCVSPQSAADSRTATGGDPTSTPDTASSATPADGDLTVELDALQPAVVVRNVDYLDVHAAPSSQYLYLHLSTEGAAPARSDLAFRFDGESHAPLGPEGTPTVYRRVYSAAPPPYDPDAGSGWLLFELPATGDASDAALVRPEGEWHPDERLRARLAAPPPPLSVVEWSVPSTVAVGGRTAVRIGVRNDGDVHGRFVGGINADGWYPHRPIARVSRRIPPGEVVTWEVPGEGIDLVSEGMAGRVSDGEADVDYELVWTGDDRSGSVRVVEA
jgi:hypothetical protein